VLSIGGAPPRFLAAPSPDVSKPAFVGASVLPGRGMMLLQATLRLPSGELIEALEAPEPEAAAALLGGGDDDFAGNRSFSFGGALLAPFANRIRGRPCAGAREIETEVAGHSVRLPRNWGGQAPGAEQYAMHGLILDRPARLTDLGDASVRGRLFLDPIDGQWPGRLRFDVGWSLEDGALSLQVTATNVGTTPSPVGIGWHPYFKVASGDRTQVRLRLAGAARVLVNNYDEVLPTGELQPVAGSPYDFRSHAGRALGDLYLDDCFTDLDRTSSNALAELRDPAAGVGLRLISASPQIRALQVFAPPAEGFVVIEPQFNLADPYSAAWRGQDTGMVLLAPGGHTAFEVRVEPFAL
jgi:aldose 1-epimerase